MEMRSVFFFFLLTIILSSCETVKHVNEISGIQVKKSIPAAVEEGEILFLTDSAEIYRQLELVVYKLPYTVSKHKPIYSGDTVIMQPFSSELKFRYFAFHEGDNYGFMYDQDLSIEPKKCKVDSVAIGVSFKHIHLNNVENTSLIGVQQISSTAYRESYASLLPYDRMEPDTVNLYFNKKPSKLDFEFDDAFLPADKRNRIFKVELIFRQYKKDFGEGGEIIPRRVLTLESKVLKKFDKEAILSVLKRFQRDFSKN